MSILKQVVTKSHISVNIKRRNLINFNRGFRSIVTCSWNKNLLRKRIHAYTVIIGSIIISRSET